MATLQNTTQYDSVSSHSLTVQDVRVPEPNDLDVGQLHLEIDRVAIALRNPDAVEIEGIEAPYASEPGNAYESVPDSNHTEPSTQDSTHHR